MYIYELALKLDVRSADLAESARGLGLVGATPSSELTGAQEAALRSGVEMPISGPLAWIDDGSVSADQLPADPDKPSWPGLRARWSAKLRG